VTEQFVLGVLGAPFGLRGFIKVHSFSGEFEHIARLQSVILRREGGERAWEIEETAKAHAALIVKFRGIDSPEAAKALTGAELVSGRDGGAPLGAGEYYVEDLKGSRVFTQAGEDLGVITDVIEGGGGDLVELRLPGGELRFIPFRAEFFGDVSPADRKAVLLKRWIIE
jgi:16S rRNA processing protein RimM